MRICALILAMALLSCRHQAPQREKLSQLVDEFVTTTLSLSPVDATAAGYHLHDGVPLDELLDDWSEPGAEKIRVFYRSFAKRLEEAAKDPLSLEDRADYLLMKDQIALKLADLEEIQRYKHDPTFYVELAGNAVFQPYILEYALQHRRYEHIVQRLRRIPALLGQARQNLVDAPDIWRKVAIEENDGNRNLILNVIPKKLEAGERGAYDRAAAEAVQAIDNFSKFLQYELPARPSDWRLGPVKYARKFGPSMGSDLTPDQVLADAEAELARLRGEMHQLARPLFRRYFPGKAEPQNANALIAAVLDKAAARHTTPKNYFYDVERDLDEIRSFVHQRPLVPLTLNDNLRVIPTPQFLRGIYSVGGFNSAPPMEPRLGAFYWLTPIPEDWPPARIESKLREYNRWGLKILTIHEAIPGHYLQFEYANQVQPQSRRALRSLYSNGPYVEGWAVYATELMIEQGYHADEPEMRLTFLKQMLRVVSNAILDIRLHTKGMKDEEAMALMLEQTFQEKEEAAAKLQRAKLSSAQLPTYFVGWREWRRTREVEVGRPEFSLLSFHTAALKEGAVSMPALRMLLAEPSR